MMKIVQKVDNKFWLNKWHPWFAWFPVTDDSLGIDDVDKNGKGKRTWYWMEWVLRRQFRDEWFNREYRGMNKKYNDR